MHRTGRRARVIGIAAAAAASAGLLAACGSGSDAQQTTKQTTAASDVGTVTVGSLLPLTGPAAQFGPGMTAAVKLAIDEINAAGGVLGKRVRLASGDDAGDPNLASQALDRLLGQDVKAVMGTGSTSVSLSLLDKLVGAGVPMCSGANTGPELSDYPARGLYYRTSYSNALQGPVLAQLALEDGHTRVALIGRGDGFGRGLVSAAEQALRSSGAEIATSIIYDPQQTNFETEVQKLAAARPEAIIVVGYDERGKMLRSMIERGIGPKQVGIYTTGVLTPDFWKTVDPSDPAVTEGIKQTAPPAAGAGEFADRVRAVDAKVKDLQFAAEQYDCMVVAALGMTVAESFAGPEVSKEMAGVTTGEEQCDSYAACVRLLDAGKTVAYVGAAGPLRLKLDKIGEPTLARFQIYEVDAKGASQPGRKVEVGS